MWHQLSSPPQNLRFYRFTDLSNDKESEPEQANLEQHNIKLFPDDHLESVPEQGLFQSRQQEASRDNNKPLSSLKSTDKMQSGAQTSKNTFDLRLHCGSNTSKQHAKSAIAGNPVKSTLIPVKSSHSSIKEEMKKCSSRGSQSRRKHDSNSQMHHDMFLGSISKGEEPGLSDLIMRDNNPTDIHNSRSLLTHNGAFLDTLIQIRDLTKENLQQHKRLIKLLEDKQQISFLYGEDRDEQQKYFRPKKEQRKSFKRNPEKSSTTKKFGKSMGLEQRVGKIEDKYKVLEKKLERLDLSTQKKTIGLSRMKKKSMSTLR